MSKIPISIASMGPVDSGKSTLFGYIVLHFHDDHAYWKQIARWEEQRPDWYRSDRVYTYLFDRLGIERQGHLSSDRKRTYQGASIVPTHIECQIKTKDFLFIDVPGHEKFVSQATAGIFQAQSAILVLAADNLEAILDVIQNIQKYRDHKETLVKVVRKMHFWNILFYPVLVRTYGFQELIVVISKMDLIQYNQVDFEVAVAELGPFLAEYSALPQQNIHFIPTSIQVPARSDLNVLTPIPPAHEMGWYQGPTLLDRVSQIAPFQPARGPLLIPVEQIYWKRLPEAPLILTGRIMRGSIRPNQDVQVSPLCDPLRPFHDTDKLRGKVRSIRRRDQSPQLPWITKLSLKHQDSDTCLQAGYVVGISLHLCEKSKYNLDKFMNYFRKGCIITEDGDSVMSGNVLKVEVFVPIYSQPIQAGQQWLLYLYGQKKGDALVLATRTKEAYLKNEENQDTGYVTELDVLLSFPTDYPVTRGGINVVARDVILRQNHSFCGGHVLNLYFVEQFRVVLRYIPEDYPEQESVERPLKRAYTTEKLLTFPEISAREANCWEIAAENPTSAEIQAIYRATRRMVPQPVSRTITLTPKVVQ